MPEFRRWPRQYEYMTLVDLSVAQIAYKLEEHSANGWRLHTCIQRLDGYFTVILERGVNDYEAA
jgi:hypothetical protein